MKYTRDNPRPGRRSTSWGDLIGTPWWFANTPDAVAVSWVAAVVCTGRGKHKRTRLGTVARVVMVDGSRDLEVDFPTSWDMHRRRTPGAPLRPPSGRTTSHRFPPDDASTGESSRFFCPRCALDMRITRERFWRLAEVDTLPSADLDVSVLL